MAKINEYLKIREAAEYLGVSRDTLRRWDAAGKLRARRHPVSKFRLYLKADLDDFLAALARAETERPERPLAARGGRL